MYEYELLEFAYGYEGAQEKSPGLQFSEWQTKMKAPYEINSMCSSISSLKGRVIESLFIMVRYI